MEKISPPLHCHEIFAFIKTRVVILLSPVSLFVTPWILAFQALLSMGFLSTNIRVGSHFFLQGIFLTQGLNLCLLRCRWIPYS